MKRAPFLGAAAAVLTGCGGSHAIGALPGLRSPASASKARPGSVAMVPAKAEPIPAAVLAAPIVGEMWRFDGAAAPRGWALTNGAALSTTEYRQLFAVLGTVAGGDGKSTFKLPAPPYGAIIAVTGTVESSPQMLAHSSRRPTEVASLGPGAVRRPGLIKRQSANVVAELAEVRRLQAAAVRAGAPRGEEYFPQQRARFEDARGNARTGALAVLGAASRRRLESAVADAVAGRTSIYGAVQAMKAALTPGEALALLQANDAMVRPFNARATSSAATATPQDDAAHFLLSVAITRGEAVTIAEREAAVP